LLESQAVWEQLTLIDPEVTSFRRDRAAAEHNLAVWYLRWRKPEESERWCRDALRLREHLHKGEPANVTFLYDLALSYRQKAVAANASRQRAEYAAILASTLNPTASRARLGRIAWSAEALAEAGEVISWNGKAADKLEQAVKANPQWAEAKRILAQVAAGTASALAQQGRHAESLPEWDRSVLHATGRNLLLYRSYRALSRVKAGDWKAAAADLGADLEAPPTLVEIDFRLACVGALCAEAVRRDSGLSVSQRQEQAEHLVNQAMHLLRRLHQAGAFKDPQTLQDLRGEPDLDSLRQRPEFKELLDQRGSAEPAGSPGGQ
jgi:hypothetical protein